MIFIQQAGRMFPPRPRLLFTATRASEEANPFRTSGHTNDLFRRPAGPCPSPPTRLATKLSLPLPLLTSLHSALNDDHYPDDDDVADDFWSFRWILSSSLP